MSTADGPVTYVTREAPRYSAGMTVRTKVQTTGVGEDLRFNPGYFKTIPGILKIVQLIFAIIALSCISPPLTWFSRLLTFFLAISFALTLILCFAFLVTLQNVVFPRFNWLLTELIYTSIVSVSLLITALLHIIYTCKHEYRYSLTYFNSYLGTSYFGTYITAGVFGLLNSIAYGAGAYFLYLEWRQGASTVAPVNSHSSNSNNNNNHR
ncbi:hypothetical protein TYRP_008722 [Tyrophagus putrescentiae]|nr:hypothetical protein TYRP_008722 [Tyrophagus putrescentiae]